MMSFNIAVQGVSLEVFGRFNEADTDTGHPAWFEIDSVYAPGSVEDIFFFLNKETTDVIEAKGLERGFEDAAMDNPRCENCDD